MITKQSLTFLSIACLISWSLVIGGYYGGLVEIPWALVVLALSMMGPSVSALICVYLFEGGFKGLKSIPWRPHFSRNMWWVYAWLIPLLITAGSTALTLAFASDVHLHFTFQGVEIGPLLLFQALVIGPFINMPILTFTEELGWRGYLYQLWRRPFGFWKTSLVTGVIWGLWHAPAIFFYGLNYPQNPVLGIVLFTVWCTLLSPIITLVREKADSLWAAGLFHGAINAVGPVSFMLLGNPSFPWNSLLGLGGFCVLIFAVALIKGQSQKLGLNKNIVGMTLLLVAMCGVCEADTDLVNVTETLQNQADTLREAGKTLEALDLYNHALVGYQQAQDYHGVLSVLCGRLICWQHLFNHEEDKIYAILARKEAEAILAIAQAQGIHDRNYFIHCVLGKTCILLKDYEQAEIEFRQAIALLPHDSAEKGDYLARLGEAVYQNGRKEEGERAVLEGISHIEKYYEEEDLFKRHVWVAGAYLRLAKVLIQDNNLELAKDYFQKGEEIVLKDQRLVIRTEQLQILKKSLGL